ncbi:MAG: CDC48 family AAA ATPase, partial [Promethearchaeota archaeon]
MSKTVEKDKNKGYLRIADAKPKDVGRGIARIDPDLTGFYQLRSGDVIEIKNPLNGKTTAALLWRGYGEDIGKGIIRIDGSIRRNIGAALDERVQIRKIEVHNASSVT